MQKKVVKATKTTISKGKYKSTVETSPKLFNKEPASVSFGMGATINLGNYESIKVHITVTKPCNNTKKAIGATYKETRKYVTDWLTEEVHKIKGMEDLKEISEDSMKEEKHETSDDLGGLELL